MIKINLLGQVAPHPTKAASAGGTPVPMVTQIVMFVCALVVFFGVVGIIYKIWSNQIAELKKRQNQEKIRQTELQAVKDQNERYQQHLKDLEIRINTIQALQNSRVGPVELMSSVGSIVSKTNDVYLYTLSPVGDRIQLKGQSGTVDSMANLLAYLKNSGNFADVTLEQFYQDDVKDRLTYKFAVSCQFKLAGAPAGPAGGGPGGPGGGATGPPSAPAGMVGQPAQIQQRLKQGM